MGATVYYTSIMLTALHLLLSHGQFNLGIPRSWMCTYYTP